MAALRIVVGLVGVLWLAIAGGYGVWWWDRRPEGFPSYTFRLGPFHKTLRAPDSLKAQLVALQTRQAEAGARVVILRGTQAAISDTAGREARVAQERIRTVTKTIIREIPIYVTPAADAAYPLPVGLLRIHDAAARGVAVPRVPDPSGRADDAPSGVAASAFGAVLAGNLGQCLKDRDRLVRFQGWARDQEAAAALY
jgi:hypothetical protein